jgi:indoleamine 2,3-dioxygenase
LFPKTEDGTTSSAVPSDVRALLEKYSVDPVRGFLPAADPCARLSSPHLALWETLGDDIPKLLGAGQARQVLSALPELDIEQLVDDSERNRALLLLSVFAHAFIWGGEVAEEKIPCGIARPLWRIADSLSVPPVLTHASIVLQNWRKLDPEGPVAIDNIATLNNFLDGKDESWFYLLTTDIEARGAPALAAIATAQHAIRGGRVSSAVVVTEIEEETVVLVQLRVIRSAIAAMNTSMARMNEGCLPYIFYHRVRPFLSAWKNNPTLPLGVIYEGVSSARHQFFGGSAAQSSLIPALDIGLGIVEHKHENSALFLEAMRAYMPLGHRGFLDALAANGGRQLIRDFVVARSSSCSALHTEYNACVSGMEEFRSHHINLVAGYIIAQQRGSSTGNGLEKSAGGKGTGGTPLMDFLRPIREDVRNSRLEAGSGGVCPMTGATSL